MLKKQYKIFLAVFLLVMIGGAWLSKSYVYYFYTPAITEYTFSIKQEEEPLMENVSLWFTVDQHNVVLSGTEDVLKSLETVHFRHGYDVADSMPVSEFVYGETMNGTVLVQGEDENGKLLISAKASTIASQGYDSYAYDIHNFASEEVAVDITYTGTTYMTTDTELLVYGQPYTGEIRLQSNAGKDEMLEVTDGVITGLTIQDIRKGMAVTIEDENSGKTLIGYYIVEDYPMFGPGYLKELGNLPILAGMIAAGCVLVSAGRKLVKKREQSRVADSQDR